MLMTVIVCDRCQSEMEDGNDIYHEQWFRFSIYLKNSINTNEQDIHLCNDCKVQFDSFLKRK